MTYAELASFVRKILSRTAQAPAQTANTAPVAEQTPGAIAQHPAPARMSPTPRQPTPLIPMGTASFVQLCIRPNRGSDAQSRPITHNRRKPPSPPPQPPPAQLAHTPPTPPPCLF